MPSTNLAPRLPQVASYRYGATKWDDYLRDIQTAVLVSANSQNIAVQNSEATNAARLHDLQGELNWGFTLLHDQLDAQRRQLEEISKLLEQIKEAIGLERTNRAREAMSLGRKHIRQGLFVEGLRELRMAEQENDVDFILQLQIGKLRLYGQNKDETVVDFDAAEHHLLLAKKYALAARVDLGGEANTFVAEACYHLAILEYIRSSDHSKSKSSQLASACLREAILHLESSPVQTAQHKFLFARCHSLLEEWRVAYETLLELSDTDRRYAILAMNEPDFTGIAEAITKIPHDLRTSPGPATAAAFASLDAATEAIYRATEADVDGQFRNALRELSDGLQAADLALDTGSINSRELSQTAEHARKSAIELGKQAIDLRERAYKKQLEHLRGRVFYLQESIRKETAMTAAKPPLRDLGVWSVTLFCCGFCAWFVVGMWSESYRQLFEHSDHFDNKLLILVWISVSVVVSFLFMMKFQISFKREYSHARKRINDAMTEMVPLQQQIAAIESDLLVLKSLSDKPMSRVRKRVEASKLLGELPTHLHRTHRWQ